MTRLLVLPVFLIFAALMPARGVAAPGLDALMQALSIDELLAVMQAEGEAYGENLEAELFPGRGGEVWAVQVARIYDGARMRRILRDSLSETLTPEDIAVLSAFFGSATGERIVRLEVSARRALLEPEIEEASRARLAAMRAEGHPRLDLIARFVAVNGLVDANVVSALNANFAFYLGLSAGGAFETDLSEAEMLADVAAQAPEIRDDAETWLYAYLAMAFDPLPDEALDAYIDLSESAAGQALNTALLEGFGTTFDIVSRELGVAAAAYIAGEDI